MHCRLSHVRYQSAALNRCLLRNRLFVIKRAMSPMCRYGCDKTEDLTHVLFECQIVNHERESIHEICREKGFAETIRNCFTRRELQIPIEKLLLKFLCSEVPD